MTKYRLDYDPDTGKPCMVADPEGIYYSVGEADREITERDKVFAEIYRYYDFYRCCGEVIDEGMISVIERYALEMWSKERKADEAGTHDGGTVPEGDRPSTGPASAREDEGNQE